MTNKKGFSLKELAYNQLIENIFELKDDLLWKILIVDVNSLKIINSLFNETEILEQNISCIKLFNKSNPKYKHKT